ncbi:hypothetical protein V6N13_142244 [Hibiscus sabdariffa]
MVKQNKCTKNSHVANRELFVISHEIGLSHCGVLYGNKFLRLWNRVRCEDLALRDELDLNASLVRHEFLCLFASGQVQGKYETSVRRFSHRCVCPLYFDDEWVVLFSSHVLSFSTNVSDIRAPSSSVSTIGVRTWLQLWYCSPNTARFLIRHRTLGSSGRADDDNDGNQVPRRNPTRNYCPLRCGTVGRK